MNQILSLKNEILKVLLEVVLDCIRESPSFSKDEPKIEISNGEIIFKDSNPLLEASSNKFTLCQKSFMNGEGDIIVLLDNLLDSAVELTSRISEISEGKGTHCYPAKGPYLYQKIKGELTLEDNGYLLPELERKINQINNYCERLMEAAPLVSPNNIEEVNSQVTAIAGSAIQWAASVTDLSELFSCLRDRGYILAKSKNDLFKQVAQHFNIKDHEPLKSETLRSAEEQIHRRKDPNDKESHPFSHWLKTLPETKTQM